MNTNRQYGEKGEKQVYYFSIKIFLRRLLDSYLRSFGVREIWTEAFGELGIDYDELLRQEHDLGLGNGGLGRQATCFLGSMAALELSGHGCGIRYKYGLFEQKIIDGEQVEQTGNWLIDGDIWEISRIDKAVRLKLGDSPGTVLAVPYDIPITGFGNNTVNTLRLWSTEAVENNFDFTAFNQGNFY